jgi:hypothetical protein
MHLRGFAAAFVFTGVLCQAQAPYVETWTGRVKQDKVAEFGTFATRVADANRRGNGDNFIALTDFYGHDNRVAFVSPRQSLADIEPAMARFNGALKEFMGMNMDRFIAEWSRLSEGGQSQLWMIRADMCANLPGPDEWMKTVGSSRFMAMTYTFLKPGHGLEYDKQLTMLKQARESGSGEKLPYVVTQLMTGGSALTIRGALPLKSLADFEKVGSIRKLLGDSYESYAQMSAQNVDRVELAIMRIVPEWSNPPKAIADADPKFWTVKAQAPMKAKPAATAPKPAKAGQ